MHENKKLLIMMVRRLNKNYAEIADKIYIQDKNGGFSIVFNPQKNINQAFGLLRSLNKHWKLRTWQDRTYSCSVQYGKEYYLMTTGDTESQAIFNAVKDYIEYEQEIKS